MIKIIRMRLLLLKPLITKVLILNYQLYFSLILIRMLASDPGDNQQQIFQIILIMDLTKRLGECMLIWHNNYINAQK